MTAKIHPKKMKAKHGGASVSACVAVAAVLAGFFIMSAWQTRDAVPVPAFSHTIDNFISPAFAQTATARRDLQVTNEEYAVQAVLSPKSQAVIASGIDAQIIEMNVESGDTFKKGDVLIEYDCTLDRGRLKEMRSRQRVTQRQLQAYERLASQGSVADIEFLMAKENNEQNRALVQQIEGRIRYCKQIAPYDGRVTKRMASKYEFVQTGRVVMAIASTDPLRAEFLVPSKWLRWMNVGTPLKIYIGETDRTYPARIIAVYGEVDPVSQSIQVLAEIDGYHEGLLSGMSGRAVFDPNAVRENIKGGFLGLVLDPASMGSDGTAAE